MQNLLRKWAVPLIAASWAGSIMLAIALAACIGSSFVENIAANFIADVTVAALAFVLADVLFGLRQRHAERVEARRKALQIVAFEVAQNEAELQRIVAALMQGGVACEKAFSERVPGFTMESWHLLLQSPLVTHLPDDLVWSVQESYSFNARIASGVERSLRSMLGRSPEGWDKFAAELLPGFEEALKLAVEAKEKWMAMVNE